MEKTIDTGIPKWFRAPFFFFWDFLGSLIRSLVSWVYIGLPLFFGDYHLALGTQRRLYV